MTDSQTMTHEEAEEFYTCDCGRCGTRYGWLSPDGKYHEVYEGEHYDKMKDLGLVTSEAERDGWVHLTGDGHFDHYGEGMNRRLTSFQTRWLNEHCCRIQEDD